jgi:hypothetical protein
MVSASAFEVVDIIYLVVTLGLLLRKALRPLRPLKVNHDAFAVVDEARQGPCHDPVDASEDGKMDAPSNTTSTATTDSTSAPATDSTSAPATDSTSATHANSVTAENSTSVVSTDSSSVAAPPPSGPPRPAQAPPPQHEASHTPSSTSFTIFACPHFYRVLGTDRDSWIKRHTERVVARLSPWTVLRYTVDDALIPQWYITYTPFIYVAVTLLFVAHSIMVVPIAILAGRHAWENRCLNIEVRSTVYAVREALLYACLVLLITGVVVTTMVMRRASNIGASWVWRVVVWYWRLNPAFLLAVVSSSVLAAVPSIGFPPYFPISLLVTIPAAEVVMQLYKGPCAVPAMWAMWLDASISYLLFTVLETLACVPVRGTVLDAVEGNYSISLLGLAILFKICYSWTLVSVTKALFRKTGLAWRTTADLAPEPFQYQCDKYQPSLMARGKLQAKSRRSSLLAQDSLTPGADVELTML